MYAPVFIAAFFTMAMIGNQPRCPSTHGWMREMWDIHNMHKRIFFSHKKNEILSFVAAWMGLEHITPIEISQEPEDEHCLFSHIQKLNVQIL